MSRQIEIDQENNHEATREIKVKLCLPNRLTTIGQTPLCCLAHRVTPPPTTCGARVAGTEALRLPFATLVFGGWRSVVRFVLAGGFVFDLAVSSQKNSVRLVFDNTDFLLFLFDSGSSRGVPGGDSVCLGTTPTLVQRKLCHHSDLIQSFFRVHSIAPKCALAISDI